MPYWEAGRQATPHGSFAPSRGNLDFVRIDCAGCAGASQLSSQLHERFDREAGVGDNASKRAWADALVVWNNDARVRRVASKNHVAAGLTP